MSADMTTPGIAFKPLRVWPAVALAAIIVLCRYGPRLIEGASSQYWFVPIFFPMLGAALILIWWLVASRATGRERWLGALGLIAGIAAIVFLSDPTMQSILVSYLTLPLGMVGFALGAFINRAASPAQRLKGVLLCSIAAMALTLLLRNQGVTGDYSFDFQWRWSPNVAERSWAASKPTAAPAGNVDAALTNAEWPGFRGADRMGHATGPKIATDWVAHPPKLLWKKEVGEGWSSFAIAGRYVFTQEQRGPSESVVCYDADTGNEVWAQQWEARFDEPMGGPGPRATPTLGDGAVFVASASGLVLRLKPGTGDIVWKQDVRSLSGRELPMWGFSSSPLVVGPLVIAYAGGAGDKGLFALDAATGEKRWSVACGADSYSSPQLTRILGDDTVLMLTNEGVLLVEPATGKVRLNYAWPFQGYRALQPTVIGDDTVLLPTGMTTGTRAIRLKKTGDQLTAEELWTSRHMKPDFTEVTAHQGYLYGIDGSMFSCVDLKTGERTWKDGRYGKGQAVLLESSGVFLILAEDGRIVLVRADPTAHQEIASVKALQGKTWNHPVVVGNRLFIRNAQEAACYELALDGTANAAPSPQP